jgi:hypothetical protein
MVADDFRGRVNKRPRTQGKRRVGRPRLKKVDKIRAKAWLFGAMRAARTESLGEFGRLYAPDNESVFYRFKKGRQLPSKPLLGLVERKIAGTRAIYDVGPNNAPLWEAMTAADMKHLVKCMRSSCMTEPFFLPRGTIDHTLEHCFQELEEEKFLEPFHLLADLVACHRLLDLAFNEDPADIGRRICTYRLLIRGLQLPDLRKALDAFTLYADIHAWVRHSEMIALKRQQPVLTKAFQFLAARIGANVTSWYLDNPDRAADKLIESSEELAFGFEESRFILGLELPNIYSDPSLPFDPPDLPGQ